MSEYGKSGLDQNGFHYDDCAGGPCNCDERRYGSAGSSVSGFGAILIVIVGFLLMAAVVAMLGCDMEAIPGFVYMILWVVCMTVVSVIIAIVKALL